MNFISTALAILASAFLKYILRLARLRLFGGDAAFEDPVQVNSAGRVTFQLHVTLQRHAGGSALGRAWEPDQA